MEAIDLSSLPSVAFQERKGLPDSPGVYVVSSAGRVYYVGAAKSLRVRWKGHHRTKDVEEIKDARIAYLECDRSEAAKLELLMIKQLNPLLNDTGYETRTKKRLTANNRPPFGYRYTPEKLMPSEHWGVARQIVEKLMSGMPITEICNWLWAEHGIKRSGNGISQWVQHPILRGHQRYPDGTFTYNQHEPLISETEYRQIEYRLGLNRSLRGANQGRIYAIPNGVMRCAACGYGTVTSIGRYVGKQREIVHRYFYCPNATKRGDCDAPKQGCREDWVEAAIQNAFVEAAEAIADAMLEPDDVAPNPKLIELESKLKQLRPLRDVRGIPEAIAGIEAEIEQIKTASEHNAVDSIERDELIQTLARKDAAEYWGQLSPEERREIYTALVREVRVLGREIIDVVLW